MDYIKLWINHSPDRILYLTLIVVQIKILYWLQVFVKIFVLLYSPFFSVNKGLDEYIMNFFISLIKLLLQYTPFIDPLFVFSIIF